MNGLRPILLIIILLLPLGCSSSKTRNATKIAALTATQNYQVSAVRFEGLRQAARSIGAQAGLAWQSRKINRLLIAYRSNLDRIFNFNYLILNQNVLPPVMVESINTLNLADEFTIRASDHQYQIIQQPRFITTPPTWRTYIWMGYKKPEMPNITLLPQNSEERRVWNHYIHIGWQEGLTQAEQIFTANLNRLQRDYQGMILYRKLLAQNMLSSPYISQAELGITGGGNDLHINDRVLRITAIPQLQASSKNWRPIIAKKQPQPNIQLFSIPQQKKAKVN